jgi:predicted lipoprotein with Yx(FWY)xxD motif
MKRVTSPWLRHSRLLAALMSALLGLPVFSVGSAAIGVGAIAAAQPGPSCADAVTGVPSGPATVSLAASAFGNVLVVGSGEHKGCSLYLLTSDRLHSITGDPFACGDASNAIGLPCDTVLWPALLTDGAPIAGPGVNPNLLGTVTRSDLPGLPSVRQVTYGGWPLYRFFLDEEAGETDGADLFDPVTSPTGTWYLVNGRGQPAPGRAHLGLETAPVDGTATDATVLAVSMDHGFVLLPDGMFPVYTLSTDRRGTGARSACRGLCSALYWQPVLTSERPVAGAGIDPAALGTIVRGDGTHQVTYDGRPLYLFYGDAYIPTLPYNGGAASINGAGRSTPWGVFQTIPALP